MPLGWQGLRIHLEGIKVWHSQCLSFLKEPVVLYSTLGQTMGARFREEPHLAKFELNDQVLLSQGILMNWGKMSVLQWKIS